jgi:hypothetical protein
MNFHLYPLISHSQQGFTALYVFLCVTFYLIVAVSYGLADMLFKAVKSDELKDSSKMLVKGFSLLVGIYIFLFQIPIVSVLLQGYLC